VKINGAIIISITIDKTTWMVQKFGYIQHTNKFYENLILKTDKQCKWQEEDDNRAILTP